MAAKNGKPNYRALATAIAKAVVPELARLRTRIDGVAREVRAAKDRLDGNTVLLIGRIGGLDERLRDHEQRIQELERGR